VRRAKAGTRIPKPGLAVTVTKETKPVVTRVPIGEWGLVEFETSASAKVTISRRDARGRSARVEFDPHNGVVSVAAGNLAFTDKGTLSAQVSRFQDPGELLVSDYGSRKNLRPPASTKADRSIAVNIGHQWIKAEPKPTEYQIHAITKDGHLAFEFSASREFEVKDSGGRPATVEYEAKTKMTLLETHVPRRPSRFPEPVSADEAIKIMRDAGIAAVTIAVIAPAIKGGPRGQGGEGGEGELVPDG
jgi:hypothetical protein